MDEPTVLVVCTANVCRSVFAAGLIRTPLRELGVRVRSAGVTAARGQAPCPLVVDRMADTQDLSLSHTPHQLTLEDVREASLILTMTADQRSEVNRMSWQVRDRAFTLIEAATIAGSGNQTMEFDRFVRMLSDHRSRVPMPAAPRPLFRWVSGQDAGPQIDIIDGHNSRRRADHNATLDQVEREATKLTASIRAAMSAG